MTPERKKAEELAIAAHVPLPERRQHVADIERALLEAKAEGMERAARIVERHANYAHAESFATAIMEEAAKLRELAREGKP